uniref:Uncharacterized protein n=1 Tax=Anguilla anguilla TaxID=7936 RepID=A0A0E9QD77_ANGAN
MWKSNVPYILKCKNVQKLSPRLFQEAAQNQKQLCHVTLTSE